MPAYPKLSKAAASKAMRLWNNISIPDYLTKWLLLDWLNMKIWSIVPLNCENFVANMALDRLIAKHRPEILSPDYKSKYGPSITFIFWFLSSFVNKNYPIFKDYHQLWLQNPNQYDMEEFNFFRKYYLIFEESSDDLWMRRLRKGISRLIFSDCDL